MSKVETEDELWGWSVWDAETGNALDFFDTKEEAEELQKEILALYPGDDIIVIGPK